MVFRNIDPNGNFKCDDKVLNKSYDNFTQEELHMFKIMAIEHELYEPSMVDTVPSNLLPKCALKSDVYEKILLVSRRMVISSSWILVVVPLST